MELLLITIIFFIALNYSDKIISDNIANKFKKWL
jgi:hypothetical protein